MLTDRGGSVSGVSKRFSRRGPWVLAEVHLDLRPGSRTLLAGGNGSGKSTLLRIVSGISTPTTGKVSRPSKIGYVPERLAERIKLTGREYAEHMGRIRGLEAEELERRTMDLFERLDLQPGPDVMFDSLSKGNRQKVILAQSFVEPVGMLVLDEPFNGLDTTAQRALNRLIDEFQAGGAAVLISAHRIGSRHGADQVFRIHEGQLLDATRELDASQADGSRRLVELVATAAAGTIDEVVSLPGVLQARPDSLGAAVSLIVERTLSDSILDAVIRRGWSVRTVSTIQDETTEP